MGADRDQGALLRVLRGVSLALARTGALEPRLLAAAKELVPALADGCEILPAASARPIQHGLGGDAGEERDNLLETPLGVADEALGKLLLRRAPERADWSEPERLLAQEAAERISAALDSERRKTWRSEPSHLLQDNFLATLSHELRTPLNVMLGWIELLCDGALSPEKTNRGLRILRRNARVQVRLLEDLVDASRILSGRLRLELESVPLDDLLQNAAEAFRPQAEEAKISLDLKLDDPATIRADGERLNQVLDNLLGNALKFTPPGGRIELGARVEGETVSLTVSDTGSGIPTDLLPVIFDRFQQGERMRTEKGRGLGLGLFICRHVASLHQGTIKAHSEGPGRGTCITLCLPVSGPTSQEALTASRS